MAAAEKEEDALVGPGHEHRVVGERGSRDLARVTALLQGDRHADAFVEDPERAVEEAVLQGQAGDLRDGEDVRLLDPDLLGR